MGLRIKYCLTLSVMASAVALGGIPEREPVDPLTLPQALALTLLRSPELAAFSYEVRAAEARVLQARVLPNPELGIEVEEYDRGGAGFDSSETAVVLGQLFELGRKRRWRTRVAEAEGELAGWDYESKRLDVLTTTTQRFMAVLASRRRLELAGAVVDLSEKTHRAVDERVKAGKEPPLQAAKTAAQLELARLDADEAQNVLDVSRQRLAAMWGVELPPFRDVAGDLDAVVASIPSLSELRPRLWMNPDLARWDSEIRLRKAAVSSEKVQRVPDLEASVGYLHYEEDGTDALTFGVGVPLPLFDRNQGNIAVAKLALAKAETERSANALVLAAELAESHGELTSAHRRVKALRSSVVPAMEQAFEAAHEGYIQGKFGVLDLLDAQRGLFNTEHALLDALSDYHAAFARVQRLAGTDIEALNPHNEEESK